MGHKVFFQKSYEDNNHFFVSGLYFPHHKQLVANDTNVNRIKLDLNGDKQDSSSS